MQLLVDGDRHHRARRARRGARRLATPVLSAALTTLSLTTLSLTGVGSTALAVAQPPAWTVQQSYPPVPGTSAVSCPTTSDCTVVGNADSGPDADILATTDGGTVWTDEEAPQGVVSLTAVVCPSSTDCFAIGHGPGGDSVILSTANGGGSWSAQPVPANLRMGTMACPTTDDCWAAGSDSADQSAVLATSNGWATWSSQSVPDEGGLTGIACPSTAACFAISNEAILMMSGSTWSTEDQFWGTTTSPSAVACPTVSACYVATDTGVLATSDAGATWSDETTPAGDTLTDIACPAVGTCYATGNEGTSPPTFPPVVAEMTSGGSWANVATFTGSLAAIACPSPSTCVAVGTLVVATTNGGSSWATQQTPAGINQFTAVACPSTAECFVVGPDGILATTDGGSAWGPETVPAGSGDFVAVTCPTVDDCYALGMSSGTVALLATTDAGAVWTVEPIPDSSGLPKGIACPTVSTCSVAEGDAAGAAVLTTSDGGSTWTSDTLPAGAENLTGVACPSTNDCFVTMSIGLATSSGGILATTDGGSTWTTQMASGDFTGVTCTSTSTCFATGDGVDQTTDGGATWTADDAPNQEAAAPACASATQCYAVVDNDGAFSQAVLATGNAGTSWGDETLPPNLGLSGIACPSTTECVAVGEGQGTAGGVILSGPGITNVPSTTAISTSASDGVVTTGSAVTYQAWVTGTAGTPTGTVTFMLNELSVCIAPLSDGSATCTSSVTPVGDGEAWAVYSGDATHAASAAPTSLDVAPVPTTITVTASPSTTTFGATEAITATVSPSTPDPPTGSIVLAVDGGSCTVELVGGSAGCSMEPDQTDGTETVTATYGGDAIFAASTASTTITVDPNPSTTTISISPPSAAYGTVVTYSATVSSPASGFDPAVGDYGVRFTAGAQFLCIANLDMVVTSAPNEATGSCQAATAPGGHHAVTAVYLAGPAYAESSATAEQTVTPAPTTLHLVASLNPVTVGHTVTYEASVGPDTAEGTIRFLSGTTVIGGCTGRTSGGTAICSVTYRHRGTYRIQAIFAANSDYALSKSKVLTEKVT